MNSLFRGFINEKNIHDRYIIKFKIYILCIFSIIECLFSCNVIGLCFCDGMKIRVRFVCLVMTVQVGRLLEISLSVVYQATVTRQDNNYGGPQVQNKCFFSKQYLSFRNTLLFLQNKLHSFQNKCFFSKQMFHFKTNVSFQNKCFISKQMFHFETNV